ncbi:MAG: hypothetical protein CVV03_08550 [Firmicutes bacterium HGW-Firmicutes-8]|nr:MAG: hypothetical protein CVV03_08550 [Firmicutes bacterium HGW-Firmicutes-8]
MQRNSIFRRFMASTTILAVALTFLWPAGFAAAYTEVSRTSSKDPVAEGVTLEKINIQTAQGIIKVDVLTVDLTNPYVKVDTMVGKNGILTKNQCVSNMANETGAVAAINGDFFQMKEDAPIGPTIESGELVTSPAQRTDTYAFGLTKDNRPIFPIFSFKGSVTSPGGVQFQLFGINKPTYLAYLPDNNTATDANRLNMYTPTWGPQTRGPLPGLTGMVEMVVVNDYVSEIRIGQPKANIPADGYVLVGHGTAAQFLTTNFKVGDQVQVSYEVTPETGNLQAAVGGLALIVDQGKRHWFTQTISGEKAKTGIGASQDGNTLYLVVVDGGSPSRGMTQGELADFMASYGVWTAVNLDGGGSSTMVARQLGDETVTLVNNPVLGSQRSIPNGLGIFSTAPPGTLAGLKLSGPSRILVGTQKTFTAKGYDEHYNPFAVNPANMTWEVTPDLGTFEGSTFTPVTSGSGKVTATCGNVIQEYPVRVLGSSDIAKLEVLPSTIALDPNESVNISVKVTTKQGEVFNLQPSEYEAKLTEGVGTLNGSIITAGSVMTAGQLTVKIDSTTAIARVTVGGIEQPFYGFETTKPIKYEDYPVGKVPGSFRYTGPNEPAFRGTGAARLEYDFTGTTKTAAAYANFPGGLALPGQPISLGLWVMGDEGNGHWLRAKVIDAAGVEKLLDFSREFDWKGWKRVTADIPADVKLPVRLTDIYLVEAGDAQRDKGVIYFDELSVTNAPAVGETITETPEPEELLAQKDFQPGNPASMKLGENLNLTFSNPADSTAYTIFARQIWSTALPTPGYYPIMPLYNITGIADGDDVEKLPELMKIQIKIKDITGLDKIRVMFWDEEKSAWKQIPCMVDAVKGTVTAKTNLLGVFGLMQDARPRPVYSDTSFNWAKDIISDMAAKRIVNGYPDGRFLPNQGITRGEFVTLLANTLGWAAETTNFKFADEIPSWALGSVAAAVNQGIVKGYDDGTFQPNRVINRAEMAVMLDKALGLANSSKPSNYGDARSIPFWAVQAIRNTKVTGIMLGSGNRFRPKDVANRAEATAVMAKALMYYIQS